VRRIVTPLRSCLATAKREGLIRTNPADGAALPHRPRVEGVEGEEERRAFTREQLDVVLRVVHPRHRLLFEFLASTGVRWSEVVALKWGDLMLDGDSPRVKVRRALVRGRLKPPKSRHARRDVPLSASLVSELRKRRGDRDALVFASRKGTPLHYSNIRRRVLRPAIEEAAASWAGFHTFRHTAASLLFERGANAVQVQRWLGHHSPAFTLSTYVHLLDSGVGEPLELDAELASTAPRVSHFAVPTTTAARRMSWCRPVSG
jgi:integrase